MPKQTLKAHFNLNRTQLDTLLAGLNLLIKDCQTGQLDDPVWGICYNWRSLVKDPSIRDWTYVLVNRLGAGWPDSCCPGRSVPYPIKEDPRYHHWEGPNLAARLSLMRYIAHRLRDWRRRTPT